jgi:alpha-glucosidase
MRHLIALLIFLNVSVNVFCQTNCSVISPDKTIRITILNSNSKLCYTIEKNNQSVIAKSDLLWSIDDLRLGDKIISFNEIKKESENTTYSTRGIHSLAINNYNSSLFLVKTTSKDFKLEVKAFNSGVAFRYLAETNGNSVVDDFSTFVIPEKTTIWSQNNIKYYEGRYIKQPVDSLKIQQIAGPPVTIKYPQKNLYAAITEGGLVDFAGMALEVSDKRTFKTKLAGKVLKSGSIKTPWRIVMIGDLNTLVNSDIVSNVSPEPDPVIFPKGSDTDWIKSGRCVWSWLANKRDITLENMKEFSKMASQLGFEYNLIDEGWGNWKEGEKDNWKLMKELVDFSAPLNVKIWVWKAYPDRKGIDGINTPEKRKMFFKKCSEIGIAGLKIDFFDSESQEIIDFYQSALYDAAEFHLMINFHGSNKPTGESRTFPNEMTREGVRGLENRAPWAEHNTILPFTRYLAGHADFTPLTFNEKRIGETSWCHQIATAIVYTSPLLCYGTSPDDLLNNPARDFICSIPSVWDETRVLPPSEINDIAIFARRKGNTWFLAGLTNELKTSLKIDISFLKKGNYKCQLLKDDAAKQQNLVIEKSEIKAKNSLIINMNKAGGFAASIEPN